jgi:hypothetical protein
LGPKERVRETARNEMAVKPLKTNNSAKSPMRHPQQFQRLRASQAKRFVSLGETFVSFSPVLAALRLKTKWSEAYCGGWGRKAPTTPGWLRFARNDDGGSTQSKLLLEKVAQKNS